MNTHSHTHTDELKNACVEHQLGKNGRSIAIIGEAMIIHGSATARDNADVLILGEIHGPVEARGAVVITKGAKVFGGVKASRLCVLGELDATAADGTSEVIVDGLLDVRASGIVHAASINYVHLRSEAGGRISGKISYSEQSQLELPEQDEPAGEALEAQSSSSASHDSVDIPLEVQPEPQDGAEGRTHESLGSPHVRPAFEAPEDMVEIEPSRLAAVLQMPKLDGTFGGSRGG